MTTILGYLTIAFLLFLLYRFLEDIIAGMWEGPAIMIGLILIGVGGIRMKYGEDWGREIFWSGILIQALSWGSIIKKNWKK